MALRLRGDAKKRLIWGVVAIAIILLGVAFSDLRSGIYQFPIADWANVAIDWLVKTLSPVFTIIKNITAIILNNLAVFLRWLPWWSVLALVTMVAYLIAGRRIAIFSAAGLYLIGIFGLWELSMETLALVATAVVISAGIGIPLGVLCGLSDRVYGMVRPVSGRATGINSRLGSRRSAEPAGHY